MPSDRTSLQTFKRLIGEVDLSPAEVKSTEVVPVMGNPTPKESAHRLWSARTSPSECRCAA